MQAQFVDAKKVHYLNEHTLLDQSLDFIAVKDILFKK
jgi:hypothetical protein